MASSLSCVLRDWSVSSIRRMNLPFCCRAQSQLNSAVRAAFALNVVEPKSSGIGGGGFALVYTAKDRQVHVIDFREVAPLAARPDMYIVDGQPRQDLANAGPLSVAVPAAVKGYA